MKKQIIVNVNVEGRTVVDAAKVLMAAAHRLERANMAFDEGLEQHLFDLTDHTGQKIGSVSYVSGPITLEQMEAKGWLPKV